MLGRNTFFPERIFSVVADPNQDPPRAFISPHRYIQGEGVLDHLGHYMSILPSRRPAVLITEGGRQRVGSQIETSFKQVGIEPYIEIFRGECSFEEVERVTAAIQKSSLPTDSLVAVGGGKCIDAGKCVSFRLGVPAVICPTIASTDAPCSAVSVIYTPEGVGIGPEFFPNSPALVVVDTRIIASSPIRHLIAGMGDALATFYEARTCFRNPSGRNMIGARMTIAALALAELCAKTVYEDGRKAVEAVERGNIDTSVENIIEANTLLSGLGFESGGLSIAHAMAAGLTVIPTLHRNFLHGELVGFGLLAQLILEQQSDDVLKVMSFLKEVRLPASFNQLQLDIPRDSESLMEAMSAAMNEPFVNTEPFEVTPSLLFSALVEADRLARES